jgi:hypothetical protein
LSRLEKLLEILFAWLQAFLGDSMLLGLFVCFLTSFLDDYDCSETATSADHNDDSSETTTSANHDYNAATKTSGKHDRESKHRVATILQKY